MNQTKLRTYPLSASQFVEWAMHKVNKPRVMGIIEHYVHHQTVTKYQVQTVVQPTNEDNWFSKENMPSIVRTAQLVMSEGKVSAIYKDLKLNGRIDQLYQYNGSFVLVDTKSHEYASLKDQLQLSFYALVLSLMGYKIADVAFIRSVYNNEVFYNLVELVPTEAMKEIIREVE